MVNYAEDADFFGRARKKRYRTPEEAAAAKKRRNERRSESDWESLARDVVYRQLGMAERSVKQLRDSLSRRDVPPEIAHTVLEKFVAAGLVDDRRFAQTYARAAKEAKRTSRRKLAADLAKKGISREDIEAVTDDFSPEDELSAARAITEKKMRSLRGADRETVKRRVYGALARRGFSYEIIRRSMEEIE
ncbi:regulatory protein RecX [Arcanobacterium sp. S3PF19]|uniref:regulatory protein RecX n=1 Tax=Arcanobacterium sp. S3PF19 TaxID=1219585 RepID=UPI0006918826|nr:regulatory protein RecX [Arcanobacterium sp. S3PF19]